MTARKKSTDKATKLPAPATKTPKSAKPARAGAAKKSAATSPSEAAAAIVAAVTRAAAPELVATPATPAPAPVATPAAKSEIREVAAPAVTTAITAQIDVGFGNTLFIRGDGPGLSWQRGIPMKNVARDRWHVQLGEAARPFVFKFLVNDVTWCAGEDFVLAAGGRATFAPVF